MTPYRRLWWLLISLLLISCSSSDTEEETQNSLEGIWERQFDVPNHQGISAIERFEVSGNQWYLWQRVSISSADNGATLSPPLQLEYRYNGTLNPDKTIKQETFDSHRIVLEEINFENFLYIDSRSTRGLGGLGGIAVYGIWVFKDFNLEQSDYAASVEVSLDEIGLSFLYDNLGPPTIFPIRTSEDFFNNAEERFVKTDYSEYWPAPDYTKLRQIKQDTLNARSLWETNGTNTYSFEFVQEYSDCHYNILNTGKTIRVDVEGGEVIGAFETEDEIQLDTEENWFPTFENLFDRLESYSETDTLSISENPSDHRSYPSFNEQFGYPTSFVIDASIAECDSYYIQVINLL